MLVIKKNLSSLLVIPEPEDKLLGTLELLEIFQQLLDANAHPKCVVGKRDSLGLYFSTVEERDKALQALSR